MTKRGTGSKPGNRRVRHFMIPLDDYPDISTTDTLRDAIGEMDRAQLEVRGRKSLPRCLLVFDEDDALVGLLRRRDVMRGLEPKVLVDRPLEYRKKAFDIDVDPNLSELSFDQVRRGVGEQAGRPVSDVMQPIRWTVQADDHCVKAVYECVTCSVATLPVLDGDEVVGVVRSVDLLHELAQIALHE